jgi:dTDP-4-dehydrorhamnose reductase
VGDDTRISPTYVPDLVNASLDLLIDREHGIWHLANVGDVSWFEFAERLALGAGLPTERIIPCTSSELRFRAPRPAYTVLSSERGLLMPSIDDAMLRFLADCEVAWQSEPAQAEPLAA